MDNLPLVSVITPTTEDRAKFNEKITELFWAQDYPNKQQILDFDNGWIGEKRNRLCALAEGEIIIHFDSDDYYAPDWISRCVETLTTPGHKGHRVNMTGLNKAYFLNRQTEQAYLWDNSKGQPMVTEGTMAYWRDVWDKFKFPSVNSGEGHSFCANAGYIQPLDCMHGFVAMLHGNNTASHKQVDKMKPIDNSHIKNVMGEEYNNFVSSRP